MPLLSTSIALLDFFLCAAGVAAAAVVAAAAAAADAGCWILVHCDVHVLLLLLLWRVGRLLLHARVLEVLLLQLCTPQLELLLVELKLPGRFEVCDELFVCVICCLLLCGHQ